MGARVINQTNWKLGLALSLLLSGCEQAPPATSLVAAPFVRIAEVRIPMAGTPAGLFTRVCRPSAQGRLRVVVINHGSPAAGAERAQLQPQSCTGEAARWFLERGFMVLFPMRRGFGATGGRLVESSGPCNAPDYVNAGLAGAEDIATVVAYATSLPDARPDNAVVIGQSIGGWAVIAYDSLPHPQVGALISMAGGRGGWAGGRAGVNCRPDLLEQAAARFGAAARTPMLWVYARNDSYFPPPVADAMAHAFEAAGGQLDFAQPGNFGSDGHYLFYGNGGSHIWGRFVDQYLSSRLVGG